MYNLLGFGHLRRHIADFVHNNVQYFVAKTKQGIANILELTKLHKLFDI